eukprot:12523421-Alexandrium_andersonii.AAC.1
MCSRAVSACMAETAKEHWELFARTPVERLSSPCTGSLKDSMYSGATSACGAATAEGEGRREALPKVLQSMTALPTA